MTRHISRSLLSLLFVTAGIAHLVSPAPYVAIVPPSLPWPTALVYISGVAEIVGGLGILLGKTRKVAALGLIALLIAVFPANVFAALHGMQVAQYRVPGWMLWLRLPLQPLLIGWVYFAGWKTRSPSR